MRNYSTLVTSTELLNLSRSPKLESQSPVDADGYYYTYYLVGKKRYHTKSNLFTL